MASYIDICRGSWGNIHLCCRYQVYVFCLYCCTYSLMMFDFSWRTWNWPWSSIQPGPSTRGGMRGGIASPCWLKYVIGRGAASSKAEAIQGGGGCCITSLVEICKLEFCMLLSNTCVWTVFSTAKDTINTCQLMVQVTAVICEQHCLLASADLDFLVSHHLRFQ